MSYLKFDKSKLVNLEYSLTREVLRSNRAGSYMSTTIAGCNTRKYHGCLICPVPELGGDKHLLLSSLDETVIQHGAEFHLGLRKFQGGYYEPKGHKYIRDYDAETAPKTTWRVGGVVLTKERLLVENEVQALVRYTLVDANSPTILRFKPFLAFRSIHELSKVNEYINGDITSVDNGIKLKLYNGYPFLHMQLSKKAEFIPDPNWHYNIEYDKERERGFEFLEDLYVPGYFEVSIKKGESIIFSASTTEAKASSLKTKFIEEIEQRIPRNSFLNCLKDSGQQFITNGGDEADIIAGFPWYTGHSRQTFIALPGLTLPNDDQETFVKVLDTQLKGLKNGLFPKQVGKPESGYDAIDTPLWFFWSVQHLYMCKHCEVDVWGKYGLAMKEILNAYRSGTDHGIHMYENGLVGSEQVQVPLTWMDSIVDGQPVVKRKSMAVEVNALWYNAVCLALELAMHKNDEAFIKEWEGLPALIAKSFLSEFWNEARKHLADSVDQFDKDITVRPNMVIAAAMDYTPLDREKQKSILSIAERRLLTSRGLRTLSPESPVYKGAVQGTISERADAIHQGTVWPWLIQFFVEAHLRVHKRGGVSLASRILSDFDSGMSDHCIGSIAEMYNGNPPHSARGAISQAWSVAAVTRILKILLDLEAK